jgi:hypothetical protein
MNMWKIKTTIYHYYNMMIRMKIGWINIYGMENEYGRKEEWR